MSLSSKVLAIPDCDILSPSAYADPALLHKRFARYRQERPVCWIEQEPFRPVWVLTRHVDIVEIEKNNKLFINEPRSTLIPREVEDQTVALMGKRTAAVRTINDMDEPDHRKYRNVTQSWFLGSGVARVRDRVQKICDEWVERMRERDGRCDFATDIANFIPLAVIMSILGLPEKDTAFVLRSTQQLFGASDPDMSDEAGDYGVTVFNELMAYLGEVVADRRQTPRDDLASVIANGIVDGAPMAMLETLSYLLIAATAGHETTASGLAGGLLALIENPDQLRRAQARPELWETTAAEEVVRWATPIRHFIRTATEDYVLRGQQIRAGEAVALMYLSANRDEEVFTDPYRFDIARSSGRHLSFGIGAHFCLGRMLALNEIGSFFRSFLAQVESVELDGTPIHAQSNFIGTIKTLPVRYRWRA
jgi:cytochrome P450